MIIADSGDTSADDRLDRLFPNGTIEQHPVGEFIVTYNEAAKGAKVSFTVRSLRGVFQIALKRNYSLDEGSAVVLQTWNASAIALDSEINYDDLDPAMKNEQAVYYWLHFSPILDGDTATVGPQKLILNLDQGEPDAITDFDASHGAVAGGVVSVSVAFVPPTNNDLFGSCKIYISGYNGISDYVAIAQSESSPFSFNLSQTGETVTLKAVAVSFNAVESTAVAPTKSLTLGSAATVPAKPMSVTATEISTGVQIAFPANAEPDVTSYKVRRAALGAGEGAASTIATVVSTGAAAYTSLDTTGLQDVYEYYVRATNGIGDSSASTVAIEDFINSTGRMPINSVQYTNNATIDSIDAGASATVRVYGPSGVGTAWDLKLGYGNTTVAKSKSAQTFTGKSYLTPYFCYWNGSSFVLTTSFFDVLPDGYWYVGPVATVAAGGGGGTPGGGGSSGGGTCFSGNTKILTLAGVKRFDELPEHFVVFNRHGKPRGARLIVHDYTGPMHDMGDGEQSTPLHQFSRGLKWIAAKLLFPLSKLPFSGKVFNCEIVGEKKFDEKHYVLANGEIAHNQKALPA